MADRVDPALEDAAYIAAADIVHAVFAGPVRAARAAPVADAPVVDAPVPDGQVAAPAAPVDLAAAQPIAPYIDIPRAAVLPGPSAPSAPVDPQQRLIKITTRSHDEFLVPRNICAKSTTLNNLLQTLRIDDTEETNEDPIPLANVDGDIMEKVIEWCTYHLNDPIPPPVGPNPERQPLVFSDWDRNFLRIGQSDVFRLATAANYLDIPGLLDVTTKWIAASIRGKTAEQIRHQFGITNDLTREEEDQIRQENLWTQD